MDLSTPANRTRYQRARGSGYFWYVLVASVVLVLIVVGFATYRSYSAEHTRNVVVTGKERVCKHDDCDYLVFTDGGTFKIGDSYVHFRFNSSDVYGQIATCHRYDLTYYGWRLPFFSKYQNITNFTDLGPVEGCTPR